MGDFNPLSWAEIEIKLFSLALCLRGKLFNFLAQVQEVIKVLDYVCPLFGRLRAKVKKIWLLNLGVLRSLSIYILGLLDIHAAWQPKLVEVKCCRCRLL